MSFIVSGLIALFNGRWLYVIFCWACAAIVGVIGERLIRQVEGISQSGRESIVKIDQAIQQLREGNYLAANGIIRSAVIIFKTGGDNTLLPIALTVQSVTQAAVGKNDAARKTITEARYRITNFPLAPTSASMEAEMRENIEFMQEIISIVEAGISRGSSPNSIVREFLARNDG